MIPPLPTDITKISSPLICFAGDSSLSLFMVDRFFRDGSAHYSIEFIDLNSTENQINDENSMNTKDSRIMKGTWYYKHSHKQPALCIFCISVDINKFSADRVSWITSISQLLKRVESRFLNDKPAFLSIFVCPGNRNTINQGPVHEDALIRDLNTLAIDHIHSYLFFEEELIGSSFGGVKTMKAEIFQICHNYYSSRLDLLDSDMRSSQSEMPPRFNMSFFNECLSSLNIQDSNALYAYTRCLEYYSRVQDFCLSLFTDMHIDNYEEIRQILSIVNFKIILYSLLIQNTKGLSQLVRKISGCIHAIAAILFDDTSSLFSFWKAQQYQFIIEQYGQIIGLTTQEEIPSDLKICYALRTYYLREAYIISLESTLCEPITSPISSSLSLFLQFDQYKNTLDYINAYEQQFNYQKMYQESVMFSSSHDIQEITSSPYIECIDKVLLLQDSSSLAQLEEYSLLTFYQHLYTVSKQCLIVLATVALSLHESTYLIKSLLLLCSEEFHLNPTIKERLVNEVQLSRSQLTEEDYSSIVWPIQWCVMSQQPMAYDDEDIKCILLIKNPFECNLNIDAINIISSSLEIRSQHQHYCISPYHQQQIPIQITSSFIQPSIQLKTQEFGLLSLSSSLSSLYSPLHCLSYWSLSQVRIQHRNIKPILFTSLNESIIVGQVNSLEFPVKNLTEDVTIVLSCDKTLFESSCSIKRTNKDRITIYIDLTNQKWLTEQESSFKLTIQLVKNKMISSQTVSIKLIQPFSIKTEIKSKEETILSDQVSFVYARYHYYIYIYFKSFINHLTINTIHVNHKPIDYTLNKLNEFEDMNNYTFGNELKQEEEKVWCFEVSEEMCEPITERKGYVTIQYTINKNKSNEVVLLLPSVELREPPVLLSYEYNKVIEKGKVTTIKIIMKNQSKVVQTVNYHIHRTYKSWLISGIMNSNDILLPNDEIIREISVIPLDCGERDFKQLSVHVDSINEEIQDFFETIHFFVKDNNCVYICLF